MSFHENDLILILGALEELYIFSSGTPKSGMPPTCEADISELRRSCVMFVGSKECLREHMIRPVKLEACIREIVKQN